MTRHQLTSASLILRGLLAVAVGIISLAWPQVTVLALVIVFAVYAFIAAGLQAMRAFSSRTAGPVFGHLLLGLVDLASGVIALAWPGPTALVLVLIVGIWAVIAGVAEIAAAFAKGEPAGSRALFILAGLISVAFGVVLCARPHTGAITLALLFGLFNLISGIWMIVQASSCAGPARRWTRPSRKSSRPELIRSGVLPAPGGLRGLLRPAGPAGTPPARARAVRAAVRAWRRGRPGWRRRLRRWRRARSARAGR